MEQRVENLGQLGNKWENNFWLLTTLGLLWPHFGNTVETLECLIRPHGESTRACNMELIFCSFFLHFQTFLNKAEHISVGNLCCFGSFNWRQEPNRKLQCLLYCQRESALEIMELSKTSSFHDQMCRKSRISQIYQYKNWPIRVKNMGGIYCFYRFVW